MCFPDRRACAITSAPMPAPTGVAHEKRTAPSFAPATIPTPTPATSIATPSNPAESDLDDIAQSMGVGEAIYTKRDVVAVVDRAKH